MSEAIRVLVVDDSPFVCRLIASHLRSAPGVAVAGTALNGGQALKLARELSPDVVTLDVEMPGMSGLEVLERLMDECPLPVVLVTGGSRKAADLTLKALRLGALDFVFKYTPGVNTNPEVFRREIVSKVRMAARVKILRASLGPTTVVTQAPPVPVKPPSEAIRPVWLPGIVVIGASTGGPLALGELLGQLPEEFPAAVLVVQHMPPTFTGVLAAQLARKVRLRVKEAEAGERIEPGLVLVAPGDFHLLVGSDGKVELLQGPKVCGYRPSIDVTMQSAAQVFGRRTRGVVLTGMGEDGVQGLVAIHGKGGPTYVQDAASCVVNGMPQRAVERGVVDHVARPARIGELLRAALLPDTRVRT
jgi:two-component system chemotaxis response regulator CheB